MHFTVCYGGSHDGTFVPLPRRDNLPTTLTFTSIDRNALETPGGVSREAVEQPTQKPDAHTYHLFDCEIEWGTGMVWRYWLFVFDALMDQADDLIRTMPLSDALVDRFYRNPALASSQFRVGTIDMSRN